MTDIIKKWTMRVQGLDRHVSKNDSVKDEWELISFSHGVFAHGSAPDGSRVVQLQDLHLMRFSDSATPILFKLCESGDALDSVIIELRTLQDEREVFLMRYELLKARIVSVSPAGGPQGSEIALTESLQLTCERLRMHVKSGAGYSTIDMVPPKP